MAVPKLKPKPVVTFPAPLFDRLIDEEPEIDVELQPFKTYTVDETLQSIGQQLYLLLNTRTSAIPYSIYATREQVLEDDLSLRYGLPDFSRFDVMESNSARLLVRQICRIVEHYESRLSRVGVRLIGLDLNKHLRIEISGILYGTPARERFTFPVAIDRPQGE